MQRYMKTLDVNLQEFQEDLDKKYGAVAGEIEKSISFIITD